MPPHLFLGYSIGDWVGLLTIISMLVGTLIWLIRVAITKPFTEQMAKLNEAIRNLTASSKVDHSSFDLRLDNHDRKIERHDAEIGFLYDLNNIKRKRENHED